MNIKRYFVDGLAHASYLITSEEQAAVIDPSRDVDHYIDDARDAGASIVAIMETHPHADFASGHVELAERTGASIYVSHLAAATYSHVDAYQDDQIPLGKTHRINVIETPGHSSDSLCFVIIESGLPTAVLTGDTLFVGDVGRPDFRDATEDPTVMAAALYDSLSQLAKLPDHVEVLPAHGAGSLCGRRISSAPSSTIGAEKSGNWAYQIANKQDFVREMTSNLPDRPGYFAHCLAMNLRGAPPFSNHVKVTPIKPEALHDHVSQGVVLDIRPPSDFGWGHHPGSLNIGLASPLFATWVGFFISAESPMVIVAASVEDVAIARLELARIGFDHVVGCLLAKDLLSSSSHIPQLEACDLREELRDGQQGALLDVRTIGELDAGHIEGAKHIPLSKLLGRLAELPKNSDHTVICDSGYRSSIACSLMAKHGYTHSQNLSGGMTNFAEKDYNALKS
ncbi:MAG: MBL fold metallo-hydrolase [Verrucomicrobiaceae bacterium]|nr:MBL fold metallo-hydrolase [Verrucomicrobiaceae bacterium]NCF92086.1 MBL fold metallo-hydrolase [Verrucomicrobiaceae bacterium]